MCESCVIYALFGFLLGALFFALFIVFMSLLNRYIQRQKRRKELEEKALKALSMIGWGHIRDEK